MKRILCLLSAIGVVGVATAHAADLSPPPAYRPPPVPAPAYTWTGIYFGANGGFGGDRFTYPFTVAGISGSSQLNSSGFFGGGQLGFNWQVAPLWVVGVEGDFEGANIQGNATTSTTVFAGNVGSTIDWFGTVRGRVGFLITPSTLLYGTGGWAYGHVTSAASAGAFGLAASASNGTTQTGGWTAGGGLEYAFNPWLSFKTEYLYVDLGTASIVSAPGVGTLSEKATAHTVKVGLNIKLGGWGSGW